MRNCFKSLLLFFVSLSALAQSSADLAVQKTGPAEAAAGSAITYTVTVTNNGPDDATSVTLNDPVPAGMAFVSRGQNSGPAFACNDTVQCTIATFAAGATATFTFVYDMEDGSEFTNTATVSSSTPDPDGDDNTSSVTTIGLAADLAVEKTGPSEAPDGSDVSYTVTITNLGPDDAVDATLSDPVPPGMSYVSATQDSGPTFACDTSVVCTIATLPAGASASFTFVFHIDEGSEFTNLASVATTTPDPNDENNSSVVVTTVGPPSQGDLFVSKSAPPGAAPDTDVTFTITLGNAGPADALNVLLTDNLPAPLTFVSFTQTSGPTMSCGTSTCTIASFPAGATATFELVGHVPAQTPAGTEITNTATVQSDNDSLAENNSATMTVVIASADISVTKTGPPTAVAGTTITYDITVSNAGPDVALNVTLIDPQVCATINCSLGNLLPGATVNLSADVDIPSDATSWSNTATVTTDSVDPDPSDNSVTFPTTITQNADVAVVKSGPASAVASTNISYDITVTNNGPSDASNVVLTDTLPAETTYVSSTCGSTTCPIGTLTPGASVSFTIVVNVNTNATGPLLNTASITSSTPDSQSNNDTSSVTTTVTPAPADLSIVKSGPTAASVGTNITYTIVVTNSGPGVANDVVVTDTLPAGTTLVSASPASCTGTTTVTCTFGTMAAGATETITLVVTVPATPQTIVNNASVTTSSNDPTPGNDASSAQTAVALAPADLTITKTTEFDAMLVGSQATYTIVVTNNGPETASDVVVTDPLPAGTTLVSSSAGCSGTTTVTCTLGTMLAGASQTITLVVTLPSTPQTVMNTATVSTSSNDPVPANNSSTATIVTQLQAVGIPTLSTAALGVLALTIASLVLVVLRRAS